MNWRLTSLWNEATKTKDKPTQERDYLWASEMGRPDIDVLLKTRGVQPTNPPNERSRRKFMAGNIWEGILEMILESCGMVKEREKRVELVVEGFKITGRSDFISGGKLDFSNVDERLKILPEVFYDIAGNIIESLKKYEGKELDTQVFELKSVSSFIFDKILRDDEPLEGHEFQCFTYMRHEGLDGRIIYICKDDCRIKEFELRRRSRDIYNRWKKEFDKKRKVIETGEAEKEPLILKGEKFSKNNGVEYSPYLKKVYGFDTPEDYRDFVDKKIARWNRVIKRQEEGKDMTKNNEEALEEMKEFFGGELDSVK